MRHEHHCVVFDQAPDPVKILAEEGVAVCTDIESLVGRLQVPRVVWIMLPASEPTEQMVNRLGDFLTKGDVIMDGGNSFYGILRSREIGRKGLHYVDCGISGGISGLDRG